MVLEGIIYRPKQFSGDMFWLSKVSANKTKQNKTKQNKTKQNKTDKQAKNLF